MALFVDKLVNILRQYWTLPPELKNDPTTQHIMNQVLEASGLSPAALGQLTSASAIPSIPEASAKPLEKLSKQKAFA